MQQEQADLTDVRLAEQKSAHEAALEALGFTKQAETEMALQAQQQKLTAEHASVLASKVKAAQAAHTAALAEHKRLLQEGHAAALQRQNEARKKDREDLQEQLAAVRVEARAARAAEKQLEHSSSADAAVASLRTELEATHAKQMHALMQQKDNEHAASLRAAWSTVKNKEAEAKNEIAKLKADMKETQTLAMESALAVREKSIREGAERQHQVRFTNASLPRTLTLFAVTIRWYCLQPVWRPSRR